MNRSNFEGKTIEEATEKALYELKETKDNIIINVLEEKNTLLKKSVKIEVISYSSVIDYIKETLSTIISLMNLRANFEVRKRENNITIKVFSDNNSILIGKNGRNMQALQLIIRQIISHKIKNNLTIVLDIENYQEKKLKNLEILARRIAKEVGTTKVETKLDAMNSYERRIVHSALANNKYVYTESAGEEPNRYVVIKPKEA